jgi:hypothetical protein
MKSVRGTFIVDIGGQTHNTEVELSNGHKLYLDPTYKPTFHAKTEGVVLGSYTGSDVQQGDTLYFYYTVVEREDTIQYIEGKWVAVIPEDMCFFFERNGAIRSLNGRIGVRKYQLPRKEIVGLQIAGLKAYSEKQGEVVIHPDSDMIGKKVMFHDRCAFENRIQKEDMYVMTTDDIEAVLTDWLPE